MLSRSLVPFLALLVGIPSVTWADAMRGPWSAEPKEAITTHTSIQGPSRGAPGDGSQCKVTCAKHSGEVEPGRLLAVAALMAYQKLLSPTKGRNCPMYPSCSAFAMQSVQKYGALQGALMAADRLHRCGHDLQRYEKRVVRGDLLHVDLPADRAPKTYHGQ
jgi:putative component of membrane protein insertase Oxa1/YidC/SpoIIIJ protein YidD